MQLFGRDIGAVGYGMMELTNNPDEKVTDETSFALMDRAIALGATCWNSAEFYGRPNPTENLQLIARYFHHRPENSTKAFISIKGGANPKTWMPDGSKAFLSSAIEADLKILAGRPIDMYCLARVDHNTPIEESVEAIANFVKQGKINHISLSECSAETLRRAHKVHAISAVEIEYSLWSREAEVNGLMEACAELGIPIFAYSPLGKGLLSGRYKDIRDLSPNDERRAYQRFFTDNAEANRKLVDKLDSMASAVKSTKAQIALGWVLAKSGAPKHPIIIPIPGTTNKSRLEENCRAVALSADQVTELDDFVADFSVAGLRYNVFVLKYLYV